MNGLESDEWLSYLPVHGTTKDMADGLQGWLWKAGYHNPRFKKRWVVLKGSQLVYYSQPPGERSSEKGSISVLNALVDTSCKTSAPDRYRFTVLPESTHIHPRKFIFEAETPGAIEEWTNAIKQQAHRLTMGFTDVVKQARAIEKLVQPGEEAVDESVKVSREELETKAMQGAKKTKLIATGDLFNSSGTAEALRDTLCKLLGERQGLKAVWIHDARAGWEEDKISRAWLMDGFDEIRHLKACGVAENSGLWISRWRRDGEGPMLAKTLQENCFQQDYRGIDLRDVKNHLDNAALLYLPGGNPYSLLDALRTATGAAIWAHALPRIESGELVVLTRSAGSIVAGATIDVSRERPKGWQGDPTGLCLAPGQLAFVPHYHLPQLSRVEHSRFYSKLIKDRSRWTQDDFLAALETDEITPVPIREGWFLAFDGPSVMRYQGPASFKLPYSLAVLVQCLEQPYYSFMLCQAKMKADAQTR